MKGLLPIHLRHLLLVTAIFALVGAPAVLCVPRDAKPVSVNVNTPERHPAMVMCPGHVNGCLCTVSSSSGLAETDPEIFVPPAESRAWVFGYAISARVAHYSNSARGPPRFLS